jgi:hypothetical protein
MKLNPRITPVLSCCNTLRDNVLKDTEDDEGNLLSGIIYTLGGKWLFGSGIKDKKINFCPWCGTKLD